MGVTIHFEGKLKENIPVNEVIKISQQFAENNFVESSEFEEEKFLFKRVKNEKDWDYYSSAKGIKMQPSENTDPLIFEFDDNQYIQDYCKTQYADIEVHIKIIELLRKIEPYFEELVVFDEGEYWETNDKDLLQTNIDDCFNAIENIKKEDPKQEGPFKMKDGRIVDLMS